MASQGPRSPGSVINDSSVGDVAWSNPGNATASDNQYATVALGLFQSASESSQYLWATGFGFTIPATDVITGLLVEVEHSETNTAIGLRFNARIIRGGSFVGMPAEREAIIPTSSSDVYAAIGGSGDLWGTTTQLTPGVVNDPDFGIAIRAWNRATNQTGTVRVDHIRVTVYHETPDLPPEIVDGPTVSYIRDGAMHEWSTPFTVSFTAEDALQTGPDELGYEIWTGPGRTGTKIAGGTCTSGEPVDVHIPYDADGLQDGAQTLYLTVDDGALVSDDESFSVTRLPMVGGEFEFQWEMAGWLDGEFEAQWEMAGWTEGEFELQWEIAPTPERVTRALVTSPVRYEFRYELRDRNNQFIRDVTPAFDGPTSIDLNNDRATLRTARFRIRPRYGIDPLRDYVAIYQDVLVDGNYWQEIPLGLYALHAPKRTYAVTHELWDVEASDLTVRLMESTTTETFVVEAGENYIGSVRTILDNLGLRHAFPSHDAVLTADRKWPAGTPWLTVVNDLLNAINLYTVWFRVDGVATTRARDSLAERTPDLVLTDTNGLLLADPISVEDELTRLANQVVVVVDNPDAPPMSAVATNADPDSPISTVRLGYTRTKVLARSSAPDLSTLQAIARAELEEAASLYQRATLTTAFDGRRDAHEVYEITDANLGERQRWWCRSWTATLATGGTMKHNLGRVQRVVAS